MQVHNWCSFNRALHEVYIYHCFAKAARKGGSSKERKEETGREGEVGDTLDNSYYGIKPDARSSDQEEGVGGSRFIPIQIPSRWLQSFQARSIMIAPIVSNEFLVNLMGVIVDSNEIGLVFESMQWGSLRNFMLQSKTIAPINVFKIVLSVAKGLYVSSLSSLSLALSRSPPHNSYGALLADTLYTLSLDFCMGTCVPKIFW